RCVRVRCSARPAWTIGRARDWARGVDTEHGRARRDGPALAAPARVVRGARPWLLEGVVAGLSGLGVLLGGDAGDADRADDLAFVDDRDAAFEDAEAGRQEAEVHAALGDAVLKDLGGAPQRDGRAGLLLGDVHAPPLRVAHALHH